MQIPKSPLMHIVTQRELCRDYLKISERHLIKMRDDRVIPHFRIGRCVRYDLHAVERALQKLSVRERF